MDGRWNQTVGSQFQLLHLPALCNARNLLKLSAAVTYHGPVVATLPLVARVAMRI